jgi:hypothetical protein
MCLLGLARARMIPMTRDRSGRTGCAGVHASDARLSGRSRSRIAVAVLVLSGMEEACRTDGRLRHLGPSASSTPPLEDVRRAHRANIVLLDVFRARMLDEQAFYQVICSNFVPLPHHFPIHEPRAHLRRSRSTSGRPTLVRTAGFGPEATGTPPCVTCTPESSLAVSSCQQCPLALGGSGVRACR